MVNYKCLRCGFETYHKTNFKKHLTRKFPCKPILNEISISELLSINNFDKVVINNKKAQKSTKINKKQNFGEQKSTKKCT